MSPPGAGSSRGAMEVAEEVQMQHREGEVVRHQDMFYLRLVLKGCEDAAERESDRS